jgi:aspartyl-tRNA(Asn)/glutamyl-tRNA(Gln) amidotransferase subunit A
LKAFAFPRSIAEAGARLRAGEISCVALAERCLERIAARQTELNGFITVTADLALATAREREIELRSGHDRGPLHGIPIAHKDCYDTAGILTTVGAGVFRSRIPAADAVVVRRLRASGAVMLGKTNMNEFAAGLSGRNAFFGDARNPREPSRAAGGSSSGSACAVAAQLCLGATGTDAGGSIRIPAAWTGIVGLRPTHGRVSVAGAFPRSYSLDCAGPLAANVADAALLFEAMSGVLSSRGDSQRLRLGIVRDFSFQEADEDIGRRVREALGVLERLGAEIHEVHVPALVDADYGAMMDILLYEFHQAAGHLKGPFGPTVQANLQRAATLGERHYQAALAARERFVGEVRQAFERVDALVTPTAAMTAPALDAPEAQFDRGRRFTLPFSFAGLPALSLPCGADRAGLPVGMQVVADRLQEPRLLAIAAAYEAATRP